MYEGDFKRVEWLIANGAVVKQDANGRYPQQIGSTQFSLNNGNGTLQ